LLAIPAVFDIGATALSTIGLLYLDVSIYQLLRGSGIIFVALMKQFVLGDRLFAFQWIGVFWNVAAVILVGGTAILNEKTGEIVKEDDETGGSAMLGVLLVMAGAVVQAMQFVFEEKVMTMDVPSPPLLLIGMEGLWGTIICVVVVYPFVYYLPGDDHGSYEDPFNTWAMFQSSGTIQAAFAIYFLTILLYNLFAVLVTYMLDSIWHAILDNFRPITVWMTDLFIFYVITASFGEPWTRWSPMQLIGLSVLLYGTSVYNAPNEGSLKLLGQWYALGINLRSEYEGIELQEQEDSQDEERTKQRKRSSFIKGRPPHIAVYIKAFRGLTSPKR